jgi:SAM-dependent methyltransferase
MTADYCTLFDRNYLSRGLVLYRSLVETHESFTLRVYCMDAETERMLDDMSLPSLTTVPLSELERDDPELAAVKPTRSPVEYCWTATPAVCLHALAAEPGLDSITYLDADLRFVGDASAIVAGLGDDSVLITPHRYAPDQVHQVVTSGVYNVQFVTFRRTEDGLRALHWWHDRCIEWCYARVEDGKMGDQRYLDDWPERFAGVQVSEHPGVGIAAWNVSQHELAGTPERPTIDGTDAVFYHHHSLRLFAPGPCRSLLAKPLGLRVTDTVAGAVPWTHSYPLTPRERELFWDPYVRAVAETHQGGFAPFRDAPDIRARALKHRVVRHLPRFGTTDDATLDSWRDPDVAAQMRALTDAELRAPERARPFAVFHDIVTWLRDERPLPDPARFLDVGCGMAPYADLLDRWAPGAFAYTGADYAAEILGAARRRRPDLELRQLDLLHDVLPAGFDVVFASALVDVLPRWRDALQRLLATEARFVIIHRQRVGRSSRVRMVRGYSGQGTFASTIEEAEFEGLARSTGRVVVRSWHVYGQIYSFVLERAPDAKR